MYMAFQSGNKSTSWTGYGLEVTDNLGTKYCHANEIFNPMNEEFIRRSKDGKLEVEVFVPIQPLTSDSPRTIAVTAVLRTDKALVHSIRGIKNRQGPHDTGVGDHAVELCRPMIAIRPAWPRLAT